MLDINDMIGKIHCGDCLEVMKQMPQNSIHAVVTDPPYELGFMGKKWDSTGIAFNLEVWSACLRVLKPGGHLLAFAGTRTYHRIACAIEDAGFEVRDQIGWAYGSGFPKSHNLHGKWEGWGTALKPAWEPICLARKPFTGTVAENVKAHDVGALNIDACRAEARQQQQQGRDGSLGTVPICGPRNGGKIYPADLGRWPANFIHDGSDEVVALFPSSKGQQGDVSGTEQSQTGGDGTNCYGEYGRVASPKRGDNGSAARFFYCAKASKADRNDGCGDISPKQYSHDGRETPIENAYQRNKSVAQNHHPTVKPTDLMRYLCRLITPHGGIILDPFCGSGSTGRGAVFEGFNFVGIEQSTEYCDIARARIASAQKDAEEERQEKRRQAELNPELPGIGA